MNVDAHITVICEAIGPRCEFRALFFDRATSQFYGGSGSTALEAVAWCIDEYCHRGLHGRGPRPARSSSEQPGEVLRSARPLTAPRPSSVCSGSRPLDGDSSAAHGSSFERHIPVRPGLLLHGETPRSPKLTKARRR